MALTTTQRRTLATSFNLGIDVDRYIDQAIRSGAQNIADFAYALIIRSPEFRARFPGIFRSNGTLRVSPAQYIAYEDSYVSSAASFGFTLTRAQIGGLISSNKTPDRVNTIFRGIQAVRSNPDLIPRLQANITAMNQLRTKAGLPRIPNVRSLSDAINFFTNASEINVNRAFKGTIAQAEFEHIGFKLTPAQAQALGDREVDPFKIQEKALDLLSKLNLAGPELRAELSNDELLTLEFGGRNQSEIIAKTERILKQREAAIETQPAQPDVDIRPREIEPGF